MTKADLVIRVALQTELTQKQAAEVIDLFLQSIIDALAAGDKVELRGFGSFRRRHRRARQGHNPKTGDTVDVEAQTVPFFTPGKSIRTRLNPELAALSAPARS